MTNELFAKEDGNEDVGDVLRRMRADDADRRAGSDDASDEDVGRERPGESRNDESGYLPEMLENPVRCHVGNPTRKGLSYIIYSTCDDTMAERLFSLLSRFVPPCSIVEVHSETFYTFGCWLKEEEMEIISESLPMHDTTHIDWDEQMRKLLSEEQNDE